MPATIYNAPSSYAASDSDNPCLRGQEDLFLRLPDDILLTHILPGVAAKELATMGGVSSRFTRLAVVSWESTPCILTRSEPQRPRRVA